MPKRKGTATVEEAPVVDRSKAEGDEAPPLTDVDVAQEVLWQGTIGGEVYEPVVYDAADPEAREQYVVQVDQAGNVLPGQHPDIHDNVETLEMFPGKIFEPQYAEDGSVVPVAERIASLSEAKE